MDANPMEREPFSKKFVSYQMVILSEIEDSVRSVLDRIIHRAFEHPEDQHSQPYARNFPGETALCLLKYKETPIGVAFGEPKSYPVDPQCFPPKQLMIHSIAIDPAFQGHKLCYGFVKHLVQGLRKHFGKVPMYMNVRVTEGNANRGAIRCYERNRFSLVGVPPVMKDDGPNAYMVLDGPKPVSHTHRKSQRKGKRKSQRKST